MSYHGGLVGATIAIITFLKVKKPMCRDWGDMLVAGIPLGYTFGRLGNFINAELYGRIRTCRGEWSSRARRAFPHGTLGEGFRVSVGLPIPGPAS